MKNSVFLDTNILVYLYSTTESQKRNTSISILRDYACTTSTQALNEFCNVFIKKYQTPNDKLKQAVANITKICRVQIVTEEIIYTALDINNKYGFSYFDCLMLASALSSNCETLLTEDMASGQIIEGKLEIVNPYQVTA